MKRLLLLALLVGCGGRDLLAPEPVAPPAPSLDFYAACERPAVFMLLVDGERTGLYTYNVASRDPVRLAVTTGTHLAGFWEFDDEARLIGFGDTTVTVTGPTRVDMACAT